MRSALIRCALLTAAMMPTVDSFAQSVVDESADDIPEGELRIIIESVTEGLADPVGAQLRRLRPADERYPRFYCGELNFTNQYGGYVGFRPFWVDAEEPQVSIRTPDNGMGFDVWNKTLGCAR